MSSRLVLQHPSRKNPAKGFIEQSSSRSPRTFLGAFGRPPPFPLSSLSIADPWTAATSPIPATAGRRQWAPALVLGRAGFRRGDRGRQAPVISSAFASGLSWRGSLAGKEIYCPPPGLKGQEIMSAFEKFIEENPDTAERPTVMR
jgi:hypothetical protein